MNDNVPVVTLTTGVRIANFSSPHEFRFTDGTVLAACSADRANRLMLVATEVEEDQGKWIDIDLEFEMSHEVDAEISRLERDPDIDIIIVPFPVMQALKQIGDTNNKCRVCRVADRVAKTIHHDRFCV